MSELEEINYLELIKCDFIPMNQIFEPIILNIGLNFDKERIQKIYKFFNFQSDSFDFKNKKLVFTILGRELQDKTTLKQHLDKYITREIPHSDKLKIFVNFLPLQTEEKKLLKSQENIQKIRLLEEIIVKHEIRFSQKNSQKIYYKEMFKLFDSIKLNFLPQEYHSSYFLIKFSLDNYINNLPKNKKKEFKNKYLRINNQLIQQHETLQQNYHPQLQQSKLVQAMNKLVSYNNKFSKIIYKIFKFLFNYNILLLLLISIPFLFLYVQLDLLIIGLYILTSLPYLYLENQKSYKKEQKFVQIYFNNKQQWQKCYLIIFETLLNFLFSFAPNFQNISCSGIFLVFLRNFTKISPEKDKDLFNYQQLAEEYYTNLTNSHLQVNQYPYVLQFQQSKYYQIYLINIFNLIQIIKIQ